MDVVTAQTLKSNSDVSLNELKHMAEMIWLFA